MELSPKDTISTTWLVCSPETVGRFSGVAYFFARKVYEETNIPIGIINSSWGRYNRRNLDKSGSCQYTTTKTTRPI